MICPRRSELGGASVFKLPEEDEWRSDGTCSYCGSMTAEDFMREAEQGTELGPTDKDYKVYVGKTEHKKFYFQHLSREQKQRFVELLNEHKLNIGYPGRFYVWPFFMQRA